MSPHLLIFILMSYGYFWIWIPRGTTMCVTVSNRWFSFLIDRRVKSFNALTLVFGNWSVHITTIQRTNTQKKMNIFSSQKMAHPASFSDFTDPHIARALEREKLGCVVTRPRFYLAAWFEHVCHHILSLFCCWPKECTKRRQTQPTTNNNNSHESSAIGLHYITLQN